MAYHDWIGMMGVVFILGTYGFLQYGKISSASFAYSLFNLIGAFLILFSIVQNWNITAFTMELIWALISFYGIIKSYKI